MVAQIAVGIEIAVKRHWFDAEFPAKVRNAGVAVSHGGLGETDLVLGQLEFAPAVATTRPGGGEAGHGALADQISFEFRQGGEDPENQFPAGRRRIDVGALAGENAQADASIGKTADGRDQMLEVPSETIELPYI